MTSQEPITIVSWKHSNQSVKDTTLKHYAKITPRGVRRTLCGHKVPAFHFRWPSASAPCSKCARLLAKEQV